MCQTVVKDLDVPPRADIVLKAVLAKSGYDTRGMGGGGQSAVLHVLGIFLFLLLPPSGEILFAALGLYSEYLRCLCRCCCVTVCQSSVLQLCAARSAAVECLAHAPLKKAHLTYEVPQ